MWRWLAQIAFPAAGPSQLRSAVDEYYEFLYGRRPSQAQTDRILQLDANSASAHYQQFDAS